MSRMIHKIRIRQLPRFFLLLTLLLLILYSLYRLISHGLMQNYDVDELQNAHTIYLLAHGYIPFKDFFSIYSPIYHYALIPILSIFGYTFDGIYALRIVMTGLFLIRTVAFGYVGYMLFGSVWGLLAVLFFTFDVFFLQTAVQIRPDTLMMTLFSLSLVFFIKLLKKNQAKFYLLCGLFMSLTLIISLKILPTAAILGVFILFWIINQKKYKFLIPFVFGLSIPIILFVLLCVAQGTFNDMLVQLFADARLTNSTRFYASHINYYYLPNEILYGRPGFTILWVFTNILPVLTFGGLILAISKATSINTAQFKRMFYWLFLLSMIVNWLYLYTIPSVFIQYLLMLTWVYPLGFIALLQNLWTIIPAKAFRMLIGLSLCIFIFLLRIQIDKSIAFRVTQVNYKLNQKMEYYFQMIPEDKTSFPGMLFRPLSYPIPFGYFYVEVPHSIRARYKPVVTYIQDPKVQVVAISDYMRKYMGGDELNYIDRNFHHIPDDVDLMVRNGVK
jgi:hypothetical protein